LGDAEIAVLNTPALRCLAGVACGHLMACKVIAGFCWNLAPARLVTLTWADNDVCDQSLKVLAITALSGGRFILPVWNALQNSPALPPQPS